MARPNALSLLAQIHLSLSFDLYTPLPRVPWSSLRGARKAQSSTLVVLKIICAQVRFLFAREHLVKININSAENLQLWPENNNGEYCSPG